MTALGACLFLHWLLARFMPSPWWVPNLTLAGLILAVVRRPGQWLLLALAAGFFASIWTVRASGGVIFEYLLLGWCVHLIARRWDVSDPRMQCWLVGVAAFGFTLATIWIEAIRALPVFWPALGHAALTCAMIPMVRRLMAELA